MPSDPRFDAARVAMAHPIADFRALLHGALRQAEAFLAAEASDPEARALQAAAELGPFAAGRIAPARFATVFPSVLPVGALALTALAGAIRTLRAITDRGEDAFLLDLPPGGRLAPGIDRALADLGRGFGAATLSEVVRGGRYVPALHDPLLDPVTYHTWGRAARGVAPPIIVTLDGADLHPGVLSDYADGNQKIILVVRGAAAVAPLVRCITPGTFVLQTVDGSGLDRVAAFDGPAIAAVMPEGAAVFRHDPAAGRESWQRLALHTLGGEPRRALGGMSAWQMNEDRTLLADLARTPFAIPTKDGAATPALGAEEAVDRVAAWLLGTAQ